MSNTIFDTNLNTNAITNLKVIADENAVIEGMDSILTMLDILKQPLFPRNIMTADYSGFFTVSTVEQMYDAFERAHFKDCRISAYPPVGKGESKDVSNLIPNMLLLDLDLNPKIIANKSKEEANNILKVKVNRILRKLQEQYDIKNFLVTWTGNGYHIMIPFGFTVPVEQLKEFSKYLDLLPHTLSISEEFLVFSKKFISDNQADPSNHPNYQSMFIRLPGTINTKKKFSQEIVKIVHEWKHENDDLPNYSDLYPSTDLLFEFMGYLDDKVLEYKVQQELYNRNKPANMKNSIPWIETLWSTPISDCRKRIIWLILTRYAVNRRKMSQNDALVWIKKWLDRCDKISSVDGITDEYIRYYINFAKDSGYYPPSFNTLKEYEWKIENGSSLHDVIKRKMK